MRCHLSSVFAEAAPAAVVAAVIRSNISIPTANASRPSGKEISPCETNLGKPGIGLGSGQDVDGEWTRIRTWNEIGR